MDVMFEVPSDKDVTKIVVTEDAVLGKEKPLIEKGKRTVVK